VVGAKRSLMQDSTENAIRRLERLRLVLLVTAVILVIVIVLLL
jgi:hypothetical protein